jgi:hypothetical protein
MNTTTALVPVKQLVHFICYATPVAIQNFSINKVLQLKIARSFTQPVNMSGEAGAAKSGAKDRKIGHVSGS